MGVSTLDESFCTMDTYTTRIIIIMIKYNIGITLLHELTANSWNKAHTP